MKKAPVEEIVFGPVAVKQDEQEPIAAEVMAKAIIQISEATKKMLRAGLKQRTIEILVSAQSGISRKTVGIVVNNLADLRQDFCSK